jgi:putative transposase
MCRLLCVSASGYYAWQQRPASARTQKNRRLLKKIRTIHTKSRGTYGSPRVRAELLEEGYSCGRHRVARLMQEARLQGIPKRRFRRTTIRDHKLPVAPNRLQQDFTATSLNERWVSDITYIRTGEGWLYVAIILDLFSRKVVGWSTSARLQRNLVLEALKMALGGRLPTPALMHHSEFQQALKDHGIECSMSGTGNCYDNAVAESFFATLKRERVHRQAYRTRADATADLFQYIEVFYNRQRRHSSNGYMNPERFERQVSEEDIAPR